MIIIEIFFAKINNPQQNTKYFSKKISTNQCKLYSCVLSLVPCYMTEIIEPPTSTFRTSAAPFVHM